MAKFSEDPAPLPPKTQSTEDGSPALLRAGKYLRIAGAVVAIGGTVFGMARTFGSMKDDIAVAAGQITGGVAFAKISIAIGLQLLVGGFVATFVGSWRSQAKKNLKDASAPPSG